MKGQKASRVDLNLHVVRYDLHAHGEISVYSAYSVFTR